MRLKRLWLLCLLVAFSSIASAHRLNEYLQATTISLSKDSVRLRIDLTPGSDIAIAVLKAIDTNSDGLISATEQLAYVKLMVSKLFLTIDGRAARLQLISYTYPLENSIKQGTGDIQLYFAAGIISPADRHHLSLENRNKQINAVYLVNCLLPQDSNIDIIAQSRNYDQSYYALDFNTKNTSAATANRQDQLNEITQVAVSKTYFFHGVKHILTGYDHLLFLCALVLGAAGLWDLVKIVTAFTIAHSITLTLATLGYAHLPLYIVEPLISASIVFVAVQNIFWPNRANGNSRLTVAFFFGLFHGLGFAGGLLELMHAMQPHLIVYAIIGFSLGVEAGNQLVLLPVYFTLKQLENKTGKSLKVRRYASGVVAVLGLYYFCVALTV